MRFICSSKSLGNKLKAFFHNDSRVETISYHNKTLTIVGPKEFFNLDVEGKPWEIDALNQSGRRWDWVRDTLLQVDDQPVVLDVSEKIINVIFQY